MFVFFEIIVLLFVFRYVLRKEVEVIGFGDEEWDFLLIEVLLKGEGRVKLCIFVFYCFLIKSGEYFSVFFVYCSKILFLG